MFVEKVSENEMTPWSDPVLVTLESYYPVSGVKVPTRVSVHTPTVICVSHQRSVAFRYDRPASGKRRNVLSSYCGVRSPRIRLHPRGKGTTTNDGSLCVYTVPLKDLKSEERGGESRNRG